MITLKQIDYALAVSPLELSQLLAPISYQLYYQKLKRLTQILLCA